MQSREVSSACTVFVAQRVRSVSLISPSLLAPDIYRQLFPPWWSWDPTRPRSPPSNMTRMRSANAMTSSSSRGDQQDALAAVPVGDDLLCGCTLDGAPRPGRRWAGRPPADPAPVDLASHDGLLLVAAGHAPGGSRGLGRSDVVLLDEPQGVFPDGLALEETRPVDELRLKAPGAPCCPPG